MSCGQSSKDDSTETKDSQPFRAGLTSSGRASGPRLGWFYRNERKNIQGPKGRMNLVGLCTARQSAARTYQPVPTYETSSAACSAGWIVFSRPFGTDSAFQTLPRTHVLGLFSGVPSGLSWK